MFGLIRKKSSNKERAGIFTAGLKVGTELGIRIGRMQAGDQGIIVSARVRQEIEKICEEQGV